MSEDTSHDPRKFGLIADLARARREIAGNTHALSQDLDFKRRLAGGFRRHRASWLAGGGLLGFLLARLPGRRKQVVVHRFGRKEGTPEKAVKAGILITVLKLVFDLVRPILTKWLAARFATYAGQRLWRRGQQR